MKKLFLAILLVMVFVLSLSLAACNNGITKIEIKKGTLKSKFKVGDTVDYSGAKLIVTYKDTTKTEIGLSEEGVSYTPIDTSTAGTKALEVSYKGAKTSYEMIVYDEGDPSLPIEEFSKPESFINYEQRAVQEGTEASFLQANAVYKVGNINKFQFEPIATGYIDNSPVILSEVHTIMSLKMSNSFNGSYSEISAEDLEDYVAKDGNTYKFTDLAKDKFFEMSISLDESVHTLESFLINSTITIKFQVVEGYNVYTQDGLSVMDNLNVKHWAEEKTRIGKLEWDDKNISEYTDVKLILLHNDIKLDADLLPRAYFWSSDSPEYQTALSDVNTYLGGYYTKSDFDGSLRDGRSGVAWRFDSAVNGDMKEDYNCESQQKGIYVTNQCSLYGNYMEISASQERSTQYNRLLAAVLSSSNLASSSALVDAMKAFPKAHWHFFRFMQPDGDYTPTISHLTISSNMPKPAADAQVNQQAAGLGGICMSTNSLDIENVNMHKCNIAINVCENDAASEITVKDCKILNTYANILFTYRSHITFQDCILTDCGGPLFLLCEGKDRTSDAYNAYSNTSTLDIKGNCTLEANASGTEPWYAGYGAGQLVSNMIAMDQLLQGHAKVTMVDKSVVSSGTINLIAVIAPHIDAVFDGASPRLWCQGSVSRIGAETTEVFSMQDAIYWGAHPNEYVASEGLKAYNTIIFHNGNGSYAYMSGASSLADPLGTNFSTWSQNTSDLMGIYMLTKTGASSTTPYFQVIVGGVHALQTAA